MKELLCSVRKATVADFDLIQEIREAMVSHYGYDGKCFEPDIRSLLTEWPEHSLTHFHGQLRLVLDSLDRPRSKVRNKSVSNPVAFLAASLVTKDVFDQLAGEAVSNNKRLTTVRPTDILSDRQIAENHANRVPMYLWVSQLSWFPDVTKDSGSPKSIKHLTTTAAKFFFGHELKGVGINLYSQLESYADRNSFKLINSSDKFATFGILPNSDGGDSFPHDAMKGLFGGDSVELEHLPASTKAIDNRRRIVNRAILRYHHAFGEDHNFSSTQTFAEEFLPTDDTDVKFEKSDYECNVEWNRRINSLRNQVLKSWVVPKNLVMQGHLTVKHLDESVSFSYLRPGLEWSGKI